MAVICRKMSCSTRLGWTFSTSLRCKMLVETGVNDAERLAALPGHVHDGAAGCWTATPQQQEYPGDDAAAGC